MIIPKFQRLLLATLVMPPALLAEQFVISDIRLEGLERVSEGALYSQLTFEVGDRFNDTDASDVIHTLYGTGLYDEVGVGSDGDVLVVRVQERPSIADLTFEGNKDIETEQLTAALGEAGIAKGKTFNRSLLEDLQRELRQQYYARGKYNVKVDTEVNELENNRVNVKIDISEGVVTKIKRVNIIGNSRFTDEELTNDFDSGIPSWWAFLSSKDEYAKPKLSGDLEKLRAFYLDRGYLNFNIDSTQVTITPDKQDIYINVNISEGDKFSISDSRVVGGDVLEPEVLDKIVSFTAGETFSRARISSINKQLTDSLGSEGYAFAKVDVLPRVDEEGKKVDLTFKIDPGKRVYVRRIKFHGNTKTRDEVLRREMRQMEGGYYSTAAVNRSRVRIQRLPFVESLNMDRRRVPGTDDQVDLEFSVTERFAGSFSANVGYSQTSGIVFGLQLDQENAFGSGKSLSLNLSRNDASNVYSISYNNPYYTVNGVSRGFTAFFRETDAGEDNVASYLADRWGLGMNFGVPLTEYDFLRFNLNYEDTEITTTSSTPKAFSDFIDANGDEYGLFLLSSTYTHDTRDRTIFPNKGNLQRLKFEATVPGSDLDYYKVSYLNTHFFPIADRITFALKGDLAYGEGYGETTDLPFFEKYYAGGIRSIRGFDSNSLGPRSADKDSAIGGNARVLASAQLLFPAPFALESRSVRMGLFVDAGNVFDDFDDIGNPSAANELVKANNNKIRSSAGVSLEWLAPIGPLVFSIAKPIDDEEGDDLQEFQFSIGAAF